MEFRLQSLWCLALLHTTSCYAALLPIKQSILNGCRSIPGDYNWPPDAVWSSFNSTLGGKLVATTPLGSVCHDSPFGAYDAEKCDALRSNWFAPETHIDSSSSIMAPFFTNNSCDPFLPRNASCSLGNYVSYAVNASCASDFQKAIAFIRHHNIRLVIRNTGHDYNGKSTGAGALAIWTYHMKDIDIVDYKSPGYTGPAIKMGAGVSVIESYRFSHEHGFANSGGDCPTVGVVGGWAQGGGGHGPAVSKFGVGADQALEWEVVTATGELLIANQTQNQDLFWALSGGGGGTYGVVSSMTMRVYPDLKSSAANMTFAYSKHTADAFWDVVRTFYASLPSLTASGCFAIWAVSSDGFTLYPANCPGLSENETRALLSPVLSKLTQHDIPYDSFITEFDSFLPSYEAYNLAAPKNVSNSPPLASRLVPRATLDQNLTQLTSVFREMQSRGVTLVGTAVNISQQGFAADQTSVDPARRNAAFSAIFATAYDQMDYETDIARANEMTYQLLPKLERLIPADQQRAYMNEGDFQEPKFQEVFYGVNYGRLLGIKDRYDPEQIFYALTGVGSDRWYEDQARGGRLCPAGK
ncbi:hypothetical protein LTR10_010365 [Elasticomyces elasticus]|nr:hypothetical protein LTR10_010365 [Elasticomyces elasticus]KAK4972267.1 hypothetical protein LTR42_006774 [Elasticomyces elasticus]